MKRLANYIKILVFLIILFNFPSISCADASQQNAVSEKQQLNTVANAMIKNRLLQDAQDARKMIASSSVSPSYKESKLKEITVIEKQINTMPQIDAKSFRAILPLNTLETNIFSIYGDVRHKQRFPSLQAWVSNPYDPITPAQAPSKNNSISVFMMHNEWRPAVLNLTNSSGKEITAYIKLQGLPTNISPNLITAYQAEWTLTKAQIPIAAALVPLPQYNDNYIATIPAGMTRQIWFSIHSVNVPSDDYKGKISINSNNNKNISVPIELQIFPLNFPAVPTLHLGGWDYTDLVNHCAITKENRDLLVNCLKEHFVDSPWGSPGTLAVGHFSADNKMLPPATNTFDTWVKLWPNAQRYCIAVSASSSISRVKIDTPEFNSRVKSWIDFWVDHAMRQGISPQQLTLLLVDEPHNNIQDNIVAAWAAAIHSAQPSIIIWEDVTHNVPQAALPKMLDSVNTFTLNRGQLMGNGAQFINFYQNQRNNGHSLELYSCQGPMELLDPYSYIRMQAWNAWTIGAIGSSFWSFSDAGGGNLWQPFTVKTNYSPIFITTDSVTAAKHIEAMRESVEDYEYFVMLQKAISAARPDNPQIQHAKEILSSGIQSVLDAPGTANMSWFSSKNRWEADELRLDILKTIIGLQR